MEHFLQGNVPIRHLINSKPLFLSWRRSAFNEVNDCALSHKRTKRASRYCDGSADGCPPVTLETVLIGTPIIIGCVCCCFCLDFIAKKLFGVSGRDAGTWMCIAFIICCPLLPFWCLYNYLCGKKEEEVTEVKSEPEDHNDNNPNQDALRSGLDKCDEVIGEKTDQTS